MQLNLSRFSDVESARDRYLADIDELSEQARLRYITPGVGQSLTYETKYQEAVQGGGPLISAEADALGVSTQEVIESVLLARQRWQVVGARIEAARIKAKTAIRDAGSVKTMHAVKATFLSQL